VTVAAESVVDFVRGISWSADQERELPTSTTHRVLRTPNIQQQLVLDDVLLVDFSGQAPGKWRAAPGDTILVGSNGNPDRVGNAILISEDDGDFLYASFLIAARVTSSALDRRYFFHWFTSEETQDRITRSVQGPTGLSNLSLHFLNDLELPLPTVKEQRRIAEVLDTIDDTIRATEHLIEKLKHLRDGLRGHLIDARAGEWPQMRLGDIGDRITSGSRGWVAFYSDSGETFLRIGNLTREHPNLRRLDQTMFVIPPRGSEEERTRCEPDDLLISITADLGIVGVIPESIKRSYVNQHLARVRVDPTKAEVRFVAHSLQGALGQRQFERLNDSGAKSGLNLSNIANLKVGIPEMDVQRAVSHQIDEVQLQIDSNREAFKRLNEVRSGLAADLLTGSSSRE
jgi:type I restriction enzyme S subunit